MILERTTAHDHILCTVAFMIICFDSKPKTHAKDALAQLVGKK